jgi:ornithine decarboxylase
VLAGPTCDSIDLIAEDVHIPELQLGDPIVGHMMGAYTVASATDFNLLKKAKVLVFDAMAGPDLQNGEIQFPFLGKNQNW